MENKENETEELKKWVDDNYIKKQEFYDFTGKINFILTTISEISENIRFLKEKSALTEEKLYRHEASKEMKSNYKEKLEKITFFGIVFILQFTLLIFADIFFVIDVDTLIQNDGGLILTTMLSISAITLYTQHKIKWRK